MIEDVITNGNLPECEKLLKNVKVMLLDTHV